MYKVIAKIKDEKHSFKEDFDLDIDSKDEAKEAVQEIINYFNSTLKPGETKRELVEIISSEKYDEEDEEEPWTDPECPESTEEDEIQCEFENRDGSWWCTTHNCWA